MALYSMVSSWARSARETPDAPAITVGDEPSISWTELHRTSNQLARVYAEKGVRYGDIVTVSLPTSYEAVCAILAIVKLGATPNPISANMPENELRPLLELANPRLVIAEDGAYPDDIPTVGPHVDLTGVSTDDLREVISPSFKAPTSGGSTGRPKLIMAGSPALIDDGAETPGRKIGIPTDGCMLSAGPLYHNTALTLILTGLSLRNHVVLERRFDAELTLRLIERHRVEFTLLVPTMMNRIWRLPAEVRNKYDLSSLVGLHHNAAPMPPDLKRNFIEWLGPDRVYENYTATEQSAQTLVSGQEWLERPGTVGRAAIGEFEIRDDEGKKCPPGQVGTIYMRRPVGAPRTFFYIGEPDPEVGGGWHSVGDLGSMDEDGYLYLADRRADLIISGGANVYPAEVEGVLSAHPEVLDCAVVGLRDDDLGQRVYAIVQPTTPDLTAEDLDAFMRERLNRYKCPRDYEFVDQPIRNDAGKVRRNALAAARDGGDRNQATSGGKTMTQPMKTLVGGFAFLECPRWHDGKLWMVDMHRDLVVVVSEDGSTEEITVPGRPGGMGWFQDGSLAVAATQNRKIMRYRDGELSTYCDMSDIGVSEHEINDLVMDANDRCYVGEFGVDVHAWMAENVPKVEDHGIAILAEVPLHEADVFLIENGQATVAASGLRFPNGAAISVDQTRYVVAETFGLRLSEYKLTDGILSDRRILDLGFGPDGISRMDEQGGIWVSDPMGSKVHRVDATGAITDTVECDLPAYACEIGGGDGHTLFICLASSADPSLTINTRDARIDTVRIDIPAPH